LWFKTDKLPKQKKDRIKIICQTCQKEFEVIKGTKIIRKYCNLKCASIGSRRSVRPYVEELRELIRIMPMVHIGKKYGVSNNAVKKWAIKYGIFTPYFKRKTLSLPTKKGKQ